MHMPRIITTALVSLCLALGLTLATGPAGRAQAAKKSRIDFAVTKVWVGKDCKVNVRLGRKGPGRLPAKKLSREVMLSIRLGKMKYDYTFKQVDPAGRLLAGPGILDFHSPIKVSGDQKIAAMVDPKNLIDEADDRRNNAAVAKGAPKACLGSDAREVLRDLKPEKVYMAQGGLVVVISKNPKLKLDRATARHIQLRVEGQPQRGAWSLDQVMAKGKRGKGGEVHFPTGLKVKPGPVRVSMKLGKTTRQRVFTLAAAKKPTHRRAHRPRRLPSALKPFIAQRALKAKGAAKSYSRGIRLTLPAGNNRFAPGSTVNMTIQMNAGYPRASTYFYVFRGGQEVTFPISGTSTSYPATGEAFNRPIVIPEDAVPSDRYFVVAVYSDEVYGLSDMFTVTGPVHWGPGSDSPQYTYELRLAAPNRGHSEWIRGNTYTISWRVASGTPPSNPRFNVTLEKAGARVLGIESGSAVWHANSRTYTLNWTIPSDVQVGDDYKIRVREYASGQSDVSEDNFSIRGASDLLLDWPPRPGFSGTPLTLTLRNNYQIRWRATGSYAHSAVNIRLLSRLAGVPDLTLASNVRASTGRLDFPVGTDCVANWYLPGAGYRISVETAGGDRTVRSISAPFSIVAPTITVRSDQSGRPWRMGSNKTIRWIIRNMPNTARVRIVLYKGSESWMDLARNVPASNLQFVWTVGTEAGVDLTPGNMGGPPPPPPADDYSIRVELENCGRVNSQTIQFRIE